MTMRINMMIAFLTCLFLVNSVSSYVLLPNNAIVTSRRTYSCCHNNKHHWQLPSKGSSLPSSSSSSSYRTASTIRKHDNSNYYNIGGHHFATNVNGDKNSSSQQTTEPSFKKSFLSVSTFIILDVIFRRLLKKLSISFPSSLAGCGVLFATLLTFPKLYNFLAPGAAVLAKWLPVFFVPSLITLPLAPSIGSATEIAKLLAVVIGGFFFTLLTTSWSVLGVRSMQNNNKTADEEETTEDNKVVDIIPKDADKDEDSKLLSPPPKAFSDDIASLLTVSTCTWGAVALRSFTSEGILKSLTTPLSSLFMLCTTLCTFVFGARLPKQFTKIVHPLVICTALTWLTGSFLSMATEQTFTSILQAYKTGTLNLPTTGAGDILLFLLGPAVISLACSMYDKRKLMKENIVEISTAIGVSSIGGLFGTAAMVRLINISSSTLRLCCLSRNITSPLAMAIASIIGADVSFAVAMVVVTGLFGANFGSSILNLFGIKDSVARGLGIGAAAHGLGTAAFANEKDSFPFAAIAMALTASSCTVLVSIPIIKKLLLQIALG